MPTIVTFTPLKPPERTTGAAAAAARSLHECRDGHGSTHRQRLALGSVRGIFYLDAICLHCGAHFVWVDDESQPPTCRGRTRLA